VRTSVLELTSLGTPIDEAEKMIQNKLHPDTLFHFDSPGLPQLPFGDWPLGGKDVDTEIWCQVGSGEPFPFAFDSVCVVWGFNKHGALADVCVYKVANAL
jgi:hypothetical protein